MAYSMDYKQRAVAYKQEGHTFQQLREAFGIPSETYYQWKKKLENGYYEIPTRASAKASRYGTTPPATPFRTPPVTGF